MKINICDKEYSIDKKIDNLLEILYYVSRYKNRSLSYRYGCKSGICGSCAVKVNGIEKLACITNIKDNDIIQPLDNMDKIKDLIVDRSNISKSLSVLNTEVVINKTNIISQSDIDVIETQSNCILCASCYSACPVLEVNSNFIGPFGLVRGFKYIYDKKNSTDAIPKQLSNIQNDGVWDCTLCGACDLVCPANIPIKDSIVKLQNLSVQYGYENKTFAQSDNFNLDFGFDPNSF